MDVIQFEHIWKAYNLQRGKNLKSLFSNLLTKRTVVTQMFYALQDVSFSVERGELVGIIGQNGAGKSTILKLLSGITHPTQGNITTKGRIGALINLGAGFHPELTGRENIYLYGSIMGLKRKDIAKKFDEIVSFAELEQFVDVPVKRYSSGMFVRLGFSTAMHIDPDILLVDEVLAVGDLQFQKKALQRIRKFIANGKGIVFVSHNLTMVQSLCDRIIWLDRGKIHDEGKPKVVISRYITEMNRQMLQIKMGIPESVARFGTGEVQALEVELFDGNDRKTDIFETGGIMKIRFSYRAYKKVLFPEFRVAVYTKDHLMPLFGAVSSSEGRGKQFIEGDGTIECIFKSLPLVRSTNYSIDIHIYSNDGFIAYDCWDQAIEFMVKLSQPAEHDQRMLGQEGFFSVPYTYNQL